MSTNRNAVLRYNTLDKCFSNFGRRYYFDELLEKVNDTLSDFDPTTGGIRTRQLRDDIRFMKSEAGYSAPIEAIMDGKKAYYRYEEKDFSINKRPLNRTEAEKLKNAISILQRFEGAPQFEWINELAPMLNDQFGLVGSPEKVMSYDTNIDYAGYDKIQPIFNAIVNKRVLEIEYEPFVEDAHTYKFHPYHLKQYNNRWFVFGLNTDNEIHTWNLALDRIQKITELNAKYKSVDFDWEKEYFYDIIGVTRELDKVAEEIVLQFTSETAPYIITKPIHRTQTPPKFLENGDMTVTIKVIPNYELERLILSYGESVKVISPVQLKTKIQNRLKAAHRQY